MIRPLYGTEQERDICDLCQTVVMNPVDYRGGKYHRHCALKRRRQDFSSEVVAPIRSEQDRAVVEIITNDYTELPGT